jgi:hypothetical protein
LYLLGIIVCKYVLIVGHHINYSTYYSTLYIYVYHYYNYYSCDNYYNYYNYYNCYNYYSTVQDHVSTSCTPQVEMKDLTVNLVRQGLCSSNKKGAMGMEGLVCRKRWVVQTHVCVYIIYIYKVIYIYI